MRTVKLLGGEWEQGNWGGTGTERGGDWEGNGNSELLNGGGFLLVNPWGGGGMGAGELGDWDREERELGGEWEQ